MVRVNLVIYINEKSRNQIFINLKLHYNQLIAKYIILIRLSAIIVLQYFLYARVLLIKYVLRQLFIC